MANEAVGAKRKIISLLRNRDSKEALKLFYKTFTDEKPADLEFIKNLYVELNRSELHKEAFDLLAKIAIWFPDSIEFQDIFENATRIYIDNLILKANNVCFERDEKQKKLNDSLKRVDNLTREKMHKENSKQLSLLNEKAISFYKKAIEIAPHNIPAYKGWLDCCKAEGKLEEAAEIEAKIKELQPSLRDKALVLKETLAENQPEHNFQAKEVYLDNELYLELENIFNNGDYAELVSRIDKLDTSIIIPINVLLLKARACCELRRFRDADKLIFEAEKANFNILEVKKAKDDIASVKHKLYLKAGSFYLERGIKLGVYLGRENLEKAKHCLLKALEITPDDLSLLDQAYSALQYLGEKEDAFKVKATIYCLEPEYKTTYDSSYNKTLCFIATFAFNDKPWIIDDFRWFRREFLLNNSFGKRINSLYVCLSSRITKACMHKELLRYLFKTLLLIPLLFIKVLQFISKLGKV